MAVSNFGRNLKEIREDAGMTQQQLGDALNVNHNTIGNWETRDRKPRQRQIIESLCEIFNATEQDFFGYEDGYYAKKYGLTNAPKEAIAVVASKPATVPIRVIGHVHAGDPDEQFGEDSIINVPEHVARNHPDAFALRVHGNCMDKVIPEGEDAVADPGMTPRNGSIVVAQMPDGEAVMRRMFRGSSTLMLCADSHEPFEDIVVRGEDAEVKLLGVVFWHQASYELD